MDLKDESVSERCKKFFMVNKSGKFYFFPKFIFLKIFVSNLNLGKPLILQEFSLFSKTFWFILEYTTMERFELLEWLP